MMLLVGVFMSILGIWGTHEGRMFLQTESLKRRTTLIRVPTKERGVIWAIESLAIKVVLELPAFLVGFKGDRAVMFAASAEISDRDPVSFRDSFMIFRHSDVAKTLQSADQPRLTLLGNADVPHKCMGNDTLIFLSTGPLHTALRELLFETVPAFKGSNPNGTLELDFGEDETKFKSGEAAAGPVSEMESIVRRTLIRTLFKTMFESPTSMDADTLAAFEEYAKWGGTCVLGSDFHHITGGLILNKVEAIRKRIREGVLKTPVGQRVKAAAAKSFQEGGRLHALLANVETKHLHTHKISDEDLSGDSLVRQLADGAAFAGMLGTTHLATHAITRIKSDPSYYWPLFQSNPVAFLHEEARVDPPVTSVTAVLTSNLTTNVGPNLGQSFFPSGTPHQLALYTANVDPEAFGGKFHGKSRAMEFDPSRRDIGQSVSWNGILDDVKEFKAPRGCPGYRLSMLLAKNIVNTFAPRASSISVPVDADSGAAHSVPNANVHHFHVDIAGCN